MRRAHKVDGNQREIVAALRAAGRTVLVISTVGAGAPDLLVGWAGKMVLMEVKSPGEKLMEHQLFWHRAWKGPAVVVVRSVREALEATGVV